MEEVKTTTTAETTTKPSTVGTNRVEIASLGLVVKASWLWFSNCSRHQNFLWGLLKHRFLGLNLKSFFLKIENHRGQEVVRVHRR